MPDFPCLKTVGALDLMSQLGQELFLPQGIFYWSGRAKAEADINATLGTATIHKDLLYIEDPYATVTGHLPSIKEQFSDLEPEQIFPYAPIEGIPAFRQAWLDWILYKAQDQADRIKDQLSLPVVVPGITAAIHFMVRLFLNPGEKLVCAEKRWGNYDQMMRCIGVGFEEHDTFQNDRYNVEGFCEAVKRVWQTSNRAVAIVNFPNNPTGYSPSPEELADFRQQISDILDQNPQKSLVLLFDDAYEGMVYEVDRSQWSAFYSFVDLHQNLLPVKMDGISKEMLFYGGRIGTITVGFPSQWTSQCDPNELRKEFEQKLGGLIRGTLSNSNRPTQLIAAKILSDRDKFLREREITVQQLARRRNLLLDELEKVTSSRLYADPFQGGFFCFVNVEGKPAREVAGDCLVKHRVCVVPQSSSDGHINGVRVAYCGVEFDNIPRMVEAIYKSSQV